MTFYHTISIRFLFLFSAPALLREILVIDDFSENELLPVILQGISNSSDPLTNLGQFSSDHLKKIKVIRLPARVGLIRSKIIGADLATGSHLLFLDGHCRVVPGNLFF